MVVFIVSLLAGCSRYYPSWDQLSKIKVDGVVYEMCSNLKWQMDFEAHHMKIGRTGFLVSTGVYVIEEDTERNFIYLLEPMSSMWRTPLFRTDKTIPEPSGDSVDRIKFVGVLKSKKGEVTTFETSLEDQDIIQTLFTVLEDPNNRVDAEDAMYYGNRIYCYSAALPGMCYELAISFNEGRYILNGGYGNRLVEISPELLEKITACKIEELMWEDT